MKKLILRVVFGVAVLLAVLVGLILLRNHQLEAAVYALKTEKGAIALEKLKALTQLGDKKAQMLVGYTYAYGWGGVAKDKMNAIFWFRRCGSTVGHVAENGIDPAASFELSVAKTYASGGEGVEANPIESIIWLELAAKGGSKEAAEMLVRSRPK